MAREPQRAGRFGPGLLVTAAFIGPGTIATASSAGAIFGYTLVWALLFSVFATVVLQEMAARQALATRAGLAETMRTAFASQALGRVAVILVVAAIGLGNAAYEAGNITGAAVAVAGVTGSGTGPWAVAIGVAAALLLGSGHYHLLERVLIGLVLLMSTVFLACAVLAAPGPEIILDALARPGMPEGSALTVIALIGTTVVPYNLFLHANAAREKWPATLPLDESLAAARRDSILSIGLGGLITLAILSTAAVTFFGSSKSFDAFAMADQLEPLLGPAAGPVFAAGLFAGGLTSALTAPLAAGYAVCGALGWRGGLRDPGFRAVSFAVLLCGTIFAALGTRPLAAILFAQAANGLLLPFVALALLYLMNRRDLLGTHRNGTLGNLLGAVVVAVATGLGLLKLASVAGLL
ncbi:Nramp family divalent metal transporter [Pseudohaliea rubra]|uniref:Manganese transport protein MntH n=1 Tax=Pseudohaliea rubra DSM 19751 TaxID=1265313 RepID=A0A095XT16_9GAMM|nr:Nramp family divalent metal transporter [Pseudohaliea rubra]KGE02806.1 Manganese transport protein MntH [Pseudohaliea rubra DSM 19751]